jgi:hypothetical protein
MDILNGIQYVAIVISNIWGVESNQCSRKVWYGMVFYFICFYLIIFDYVILYTLLFLFSTYLSLKKDPRVYSMTYCSRECQTKRLVSLQTNLHVRKNSGIRLNNFRHPFHKRGLLECRTQHLTGLSLRSEDCKRLFRYCSVLLHAQTIHALESSFSISLISHSTLNLQEERLSLTSHNSRAFLSSRANGARSTTCPNSS